MTKTTKTILAALFGFFICIFSATANPLDFKKAVGIYYLYPGNTGGIQYQQWITDSFSIQTQGYATYNTINVDNTYYCSVSAEAQFKLYEALWNKEIGSILFGWIQLGFNAFSEADYNTTPTSYLNQYDAIAAAGFGFDIIIYDHFSFPLEFGISAAFPSTQEVGFCLGGGVRYRF